MLEFQHFNPIDYYSGVHAVAFRDAVNQAILWSLKKGLTPYIENEFLRNLIAASLSAIMSHYPGYIGDLAKQNNVVSLTDTWALTKNVYKQFGLRDIYRTCPLTIFRATATNLIVSSAKDYLDQSKENNDTRVPIFVRN